MILSKFITQVNAAYRGEEEIPNEGTEEYQLWIETMERKIDEWAMDTHSMWRSLFDIKDLTSTVASGTNQYEVSGTLIAPSDQLLVVNDGKKHYFDFVPPEERNNSSLQSVYITGKNPQKINFTEDVDDRIVGGTIKLAGYYMPTYPSASGDNIPVDDPNWLVYATASELAFNDTSHEEKYVDLNVKANNLYTQMMTTNKKGTSGNPRKILVKVNRLGAGIRQ